MVNETISEVLSNLPPKIAEFFRQCLEGPLKSSEELRRDLERYQARLRHEHRRAELLDIKTADTLVEICQKMLESMSVGTSEEHHRLIQGAVQYLSLVEDEESDIESPIGFDDDALVIRAIAKALKLKNSDES